VVKIADYEKLLSTDLVSGKTDEINLPKSDVLQFFTDDGTKISVRPSGTEPKIKYYISVRESLPSPADYDKVNKILDDKLENIIKDMKIG
jgi:phosphoglucomutase